jgi:hypothetical protein
MLGKQRKESFLTAVGRSAASGEATKQARVALKHRLGIVINSKSLNLCCQKSLPAIILCDNGPNI